jgi:hypothetical protein
MPPELEDELDLEEAPELEPPFSRGEAVAQPYGGKNWGPVVACPRPASVTVSGFPQYSNCVDWLPASEQMKVREVTRLILGSFRPRCQPIVVVRLIASDLVEPAGTRDCSNGREGLSEQNDRWRAQHKYVDSLHAFALCFRETRGDFPCGDGCSADAGAPIMG